MPLVRKALIFLIEMYQCTFSPDHGPLRHNYPYGFCRHEPTCSQYAKEVLEQKGVIIGSLIIIKRLLSCNPWTKPSEQKIRKLIANASQ